MALGSVLNVTALTNAKNVMAKDMYGLREELICQPVVIDVMVMVSVLHVMFLIGNRHSSLDPQGYIHSKLLKL